MVLDRRICFLLQLTDITEKYRHKILILAEGILAILWHGKGWQMNEIKVYCVRLIFRKNLKITSLSCQQPLRMVDPWSMGMLRKQNSSHCVHVMSEQFNHEFSTEGELCVMNSSFHAKLSLSSITHLMLRHPEKCWNADCLFASYHASWHCLMCETVECQEQNGCGPLSN
jgi:hypothetical protein